MTLKNQKDLKLRRAIFWDCSIRKRLYGGLTLKSRRLTRLHDSLTTRHRNQSTGPRTGVTGWDSADLDRLFLQVHSLRHRPRPESVKTETFQSDVPGLFPARTRPSGLLWQREEAAFDVWKLHCQRFHFGTGPFLGVLHNWFNLIYLPHQRFITTYFRKIVILVGWLLLLVRNLSLHICCR